MVVGPMVDYDELGLSPELTGRFTAWQYRFDDRTPGDSFPTAEWESFTAEQRELANALHAEIGGVVQWEAGGVIHTVGADGNGVRLRKAKS